MPLNRNCTSGGLAGGRGLRELRDDLASVSISVGSISPPGWSLNIAIVSSIHFWMPTASCSPHHHMSALPPIVVAVLDGAAASLVAAAVVSAAELSAAEVAASVVGAADDAGALVASGAAELAADELSPESSSPHAAISGTRPNAAAPPAPRRRSRLRVSGFASGSFISSSPGARVPPRAAPWRPS